jgi:hypothetical protein
MLRNRAIRFRNPSLAAIAAASLGVAGLAPTTALGPGWRPASSWWLTTVGLGWPTPSSSVFPPIAPPSLAGAFSPARGNQWHGASRGPDAHASSAFPETNRSLVT